MIRYIHTQIRIAMKTLACLLLLSIAITQSFAQGNSSGKNLKVEPPAAQAQSIMAIDATYPLHLNVLDFNDRKKFIALNEEVVSRIENLVKIYYIRECDGDSSQLSSAVSKVYFNTLRFHDSLHTLYLVLLKHEPTGYLNGKVLFYDNTMKTFSEKVFDFNLHALYDFKEEKLIPSNLKVKLSIEGPEIDQVDYDHDGMMDYRFTRLIHNGTYNAIQTTVLTFHKLNIDTLSLLEAKL
jgi:hypothetical protein